MLRLPKNTIFSSAVHSASDIMKNIRRISETLDNRMLDGLCEIKTERNMMSDRSTQNGSREKKSRLTRNIAVKLLVRLSTGLGFCSKTDSDSFKSVLKNGKEQEPRKNYFIVVQKIHLPGRVKARFLKYREILYEKTVLK